MFSRNSNKGGSKFPPCSYRPRLVERILAYNICLITYAQYGAWVVKWAPFLRFGALVHANLCMHTFITFFVCIHHVGFLKKVPFFHKNCAFSPIWHGVKVSISTLVRCKDSELAYEHAWTAMKCFWRGNHCLYWSPSEKGFMDIIIKKNHLLRTCSVFFVLNSNNGPFPFDQNFRNFRSETEWNGKKSGKSSRKFRNTFWVHPLWRNFRNYRKFCVLFGRDVGFSLLTERELTWTFEIPSA